MNCIEMRKLILLQDSGEISELQRLELESHLIGCPDCRQHLASLDWVRQAVKTVTPTRTSPSNKVMESIHEEARKHHTRFHWHLSLPWKAALVAAASLVICLSSVQLFTRSPGQPGNTQSTTQDAADLEALTKQLLMLQEANMNAAEELADDFILLEDRQPTTLRGNNTPVVPRAGCV